MSEIAVTRGEAPITSVTLTLTVNEARAVSRVLNAPFGEPVGEARLRSRRECNSFGAYEVKNQLRKALQEQP